MEELINEKLRIKKILSRGVSTSETKGEISKYCEALGRLKGIEFTENLLAEADRMAGDDRCPFCGSSAVQIEEASGYGAKYFVWCVTCNAQGPNEHTEDKAWAKWGQRA